MDRFIDYRIGVYVPEHFFLLFTISALVSLGVIFFYAKRHSNPHFRPGKREVLMVSFFLLMLSGGGCWMVGKLLDSNLDPEKMGAQLDRDQNDSLNNDGVRGEGSLSKDTANLPSNGDFKGVPDEIRQVIDNK